MEKTLADTLTGWRRHLHAHPELSKQEAATSAFVQAKLTELGVPFVANVGGHGIVATITRGKSNRNVGLRADMDALPILESTGLPYASTNPGVMHACGHDGHTTSLLGAAALLSQGTDWSGTVQLVFQPAEEGGGGARAMVDDGLFDRFPMERVFAYHNWPGLEAGHVMVHDGPVMAAGGRIDISVNGHAGHAALPHQSRDPMIAAAHILLGLQSVVSRNVDPMDAAVITIGTINGGMAANQIPAQVTMRGTCRSYRPEVRDLLDAGIRRVVAGAAALCGMTAEVEIVHGVAATINTKAEAALAVEACTENNIPVRTDMLPAMTGEDFCWFLQHRPGAFVWIGNGPAEPGRELHNDGYNFNDAILPNASAYLAGIARRALRA